MVDLVKKLTIIDTEYYVSNTSTASKPQGDLTRNTDTVTRTSNKNETNTHISNRNYEQKLLSNQTIPVFFPKTNLNIEQSIASILLEPQTLLTPATKEVSSDAELGGAWVNRNQ